MSKIYKIAIDGHAASGKSTSAKRIAELLNFDHINSGNIYRALTDIFLKKYKDIDKNNIISDEQIDFLKNIKFEIKNNDFYWRNEKCQLRRNEVNISVAHLAQIKNIRIIANKIQQNLINQAKNGVVIDGRDIASKVIPNADLKVFMTASAEKRAERRLKEGFNSEFQDVLKEIKNRDLMDEKREHGALIKTTDAFVVENNNLSFDEQVEIIINQFKKVSQFNR